MVEELGSSSQPVQTIHRASTDIYQNDLNWVDADTSHTRLRLKEDGHLQIVEDLEFFEGPSVTNSTKKYSIGLNGDAFVVRDEVNAVDLLTLQHGTSTGETAQTQENTAAIQTNMLRIDTHKNDIASLAVQTQDFVQKFATIAQTLDQQIDDLNTHVTIVNDTKTEVTTGLAKKADTSAVNASLSSKANQTDVDSKIDAITPTSSMTVGQTTAVQGGVLHTQFQNIQTQLNSNATLINPTFTNNITVDNKLKVSDFAKIQLQDGSQHIGEFIDNKVNNAPAPSATQPTMKLTKFGGSQINWNQMGEILGVSTGDQFGIACALSADGSRLVVGASKAPNGSGTGEVRVYEWNGTSWQPMGSAITGASSNSFFGSSVAISANGGRIVVGAWGESSNKGTVRVYQWVGVAPQLPSGWYQFPVLTGELADDYFGWSVAMSAGGENVAVGAVRIGQVKVYSFNADDEYEALGLDIDGDQVGDEFGYRVSMSADGRRVAISGPANQDNGTYSGHVKIFQFEGSEHVGFAWKQVGQDIDGAAASDLTRMIALSADGSRVALTSYYNDGFANNTGNARVFHFDGVGWVQAGQDIYGLAASDHIDAVSLSADGSRLAVGAFQADRGATNNGHVRTYEWNQTLYVWEIIGQEIYVFNNHTQISANGALALSADGARLVVGAYPFASNKGLVYTYEYGLRNNTLSVTQTTTPNIADITLAPIDLAYLTTTIVSIVNAAGNSVSNISSAGTYTVTYTSTNMKNESNQLVLTVSR